MNAQNIGKSDSEENTSKIYQNYALKGAYQRANNYELIQVIFSIKMNTHSSWLIFKNFI